MRIVSIGDLVLDYYYENEKLLGVSGGMSSHNIIANLAKMKFNTASFGCCGNDLQGKLAIKSLSLLNVDTTNIKIIDNIKTRKFHISYIKKNDNITYNPKKRCPLCDMKYWYEPSLLDENYVLENLKPDDILVFDNLNLKNQIIIDNSSNKKIIDLGQYFELENLENNEIIQKISHKFEIINFNERVSNYLIERFNLKDEIALYNILKPVFMTITKGEKGATFVYNSRIKEFTLENKSKVVDPTGAGDAFISVIIKNCLNSNFIYNENDFQKLFVDATKLTSKVVSKRGARGHLNSLFKIKKDGEFCTCEKFLYNERKKVKRCNLNINNLEKRVMNAITSEASVKLLNIDFKAADNILFIATGGSYAGAYFSAKIINKFNGSNTYSLYPRDVLYRNNANINKVILFSYSGTTNDILISTKDFLKENIYIITKGKSKTIALKTNILSKNILSYQTSNNKGKERGFLSFEGAVVPATIFLKYYYQTIKEEFDIKSFIKNSFTYWHTKINELIDKNVVEEITKKRVINLFRGDVSDTACYDLESKIIESGVATCLIHEKKNFSHGRFINYENLNNNFSIYFKQKSTSEYEKELLKYLKNKTLIVESNYDGILAEYDLLIASQFIIYYIGKNMDIDVSKPNYSEEAMNLYFYKGNL